MAKILMKRGLAASLPTSGMNVGEFLFCTDTGDLYITTGAATKVLLGKKSDIDLALKKASNLSDLNSVSTARSNLDVYSKTEVDSLLAGLSWKNQVKCATTDNLAVLLGTPTIDGVATASGYRILVKDQTDKKLNGIYVIPATAPDTTAWSRATDADSQVELTNAAVFVMQGTVNGDTGWVCTSNAPVIGTDNIEFVQFSGTGQVAAGLGLDKSGNEMFLKLDELTDLAATPATNDMIVIVDVSATGQAKNKIVSKANLLAGIVSDTYKVRVNNTTDITPGYLGDKITPSAEAGYEGITMTQSSGADPKVVVGLNLAAPAAATAMNAAANDFVAVNVSGANKTITVNNMLKGATISDATATIDGGTF